MGNCSGGAFAKALAEPPDYGQRLSPATIRPGGTTFLKQAAKPHLAWQAEKAESLSSRHLPWPLCNTPNTDTW